MDDAESRRLVTALTDGQLPESIRWHARGLALHALVWGDATDPLALLVHGNGGHAHWWDPLVPALVPGWRLFVPDLRGHGESAWAETSGYRIQDFSDDLLSAPLLRGKAEAARPVVLVGHSMGGRAAAWLAIHHPERVRALVLLDTRLGGIEPSVAARFRGRIAGRRQGRVYASRAEAIAAFRFVPDERDVDQAVIADLAYHAVHERAPGEWTFRFDRAVLSLDGDGAGDLGPRLDRIRCPTLILNGARSWVMDADEAAMIAGRIRGCEIRTLAGGHHFLVARPREAGAALRAFLDRVGTGVVS
jgi:pimeloyl-ACP methyl ester carboxylesterase